MTRIKITRSVISFVLVIMICFTFIGCKDTQSGSVTAPPDSRVESYKTAMGRYVEVRKSVPSEGALAFTHNKGWFYAVSADGKLLYRSRDMTNWDKFDTYHNEQIAPARSGVNGLMIGTDGALYLSSGWSMLDGEHRPYIERIHDNGAIKIQLDRRLPSDMDRILLCVLPSGEFLGLGDSEVYRFSAEGATIQKYAVSGGASLAVFGNEMAVLSEKQAQITILNIDSGREARTLALPVKSSYGIVGYDATGVLYYVSPAGIYCVNAGGTLFTQIVAGNLATLGNPNAVATHLMFDSDNNLVIAYQNTLTHSMSLIAYSFDAETPTEPNKAFSVYSLYDSQTLRACVSKFQREHPDMMINIIIALPTGTAITRDDAIRTLNTEMLSGKGPDVLVLDGLPVQSYIDKGVLMDLTAAVQPLIDSGRLLNNLAGAYIRQGMIRAVPTRFALPTMWGAISGIKTISDMANWATLNPNALPYYAIDIESLIGTFYLSCAPAWFTANGRLDDKQIEAFLTALKAIRGYWNYDAYVRTTGEDLKAAWKSMGAQIPKWNPYNVSSIGNTSIIEERIGGFMTLQGMQAQLPYLLYGVSSASMPNGITSDFIALPGQAEGCFMPMLLMGASINSANGASARAFIAYALSDDTQSTDMWEGSPVSVKALNAMITQDTAANIYSSGGAGIEWRGKWLNLAQRNQLLKIINGLTTPVTCDFTLYQMLVSESLPFFEGKISVSEAAANVCAKANAYLTE